jgi:hypothetical protein
MCTPEFRGCNACFTHEPRRKVAHVFSRRSHHHGHSPTIRAAANHEARADDTSEVNQLAHAHHTSERATRELAAAEQSSIGADDDKQRAAVDAHAIERGCADCLDTAANVQDQGSHCRARACASLAGEASRDDRRVRLFAR